MTNEISTRHRDSQWVDWINEWGVRLEEMKSSDFKFDDKKKFLKTIINNIVVKSTDNLEHDLTIKFKLPYVNDQLIYKDNKDNKDKSKGYILKDGGYSKKLRIGSLKKIKDNGKQMLSDQHYKQECPQYYSVTVE